MPFMVSYAMVYNGVIFLYVLHTVLVKTYSYTIENAAIWFATLLAIYSSIDTRLSANQNSHFQNVIL